MDTLLLAENDSLMRHTLKDCLEKENFIVIDASNYNRMFEILSAHPVDTILLDLNLTGDRKQSVLDKIRSITNVPILLISSNDDSKAKVQLFEEGADDVLVSPIDPIELIARVRAQIRRHQHYSNDVAKIEPYNPEIFRFGRWVLDRSKFQIFDGDNQSAHLTIHEYYLLKALIDNRDKALSREALCEAAREKNYVPTPRAIDIKIARIRKKIGDSASAPEFIKTIRGVGYMFAAEVRS